jgi:hypothetical protein
MSSLLTTRLFPANSTLAAWPFLGGGAPSWAVGCELAGMGVRTLILVSPSGGGCASGVAGAKWLAKAARKPPCFSISMPALLRDLWCRSSSTWGVVGGCPKNQCYPPLQFRGAQAKVPISGVRLTQKYQLVHGLETVNSSCSGG